jgi:hypothetical protein
VAYFTAWLTAFAFTQLVEVPIYSVGLRVRWWAAFGASAITHPLLWFVIMPLAPLTFGARVGLGEAFVVLAEAAYFRLGWRRPHALTWSLVANAASFGLGLLCRRWFGAP